MRMPLELKALPYISMPLRLVRGGGEQYAAPFAGLNPSELVPVLGNGDFTLIQSMAIIEYLDQVHPAPPQLQGSATERARIRTISQAHCLRDPSFEEPAGVEMAGVARRHRPESPQRLVRALGQRGIPGTVSILETSDSTGRFCHGGAPSMAECCLIPLIYSAKRFAVATEPYPTLRRIHGA